ncbi:MAG: GEVED domain-containing protein [Bacteroidales bacterium]|nr:GEVED domain-containing protein [Bacteroidales bacterium]
MRKDTLLKIGWLCIIQLMFSSLSFAEYVSPANQLYTSPGDYISKVSFNTINNTSTVSTSGGSAALFGNYTSVSTTVNPSTTYSLSVSTFWSEYGSDKLYVYVFFDWNHDYDFLDANEYYIVANGTSHTGTGGHTYNLTAQNITIPSDALLSSIRMRVRMIAQASDPGITGMRNFTGGYYGEIEDYTIVVATPVAAPTVTGISPTSGTTSGGTSVVITGTNLTGATAVSFGGTAATSFTVNSATQITATSPAKSAETVDITVTTSGGTSATGTADQFTYLTTGTFTGAVSTDWNTAGNWAGGSVPTSTTDVTIPSDKTAVIDAITQASCNNLTVTGSLTIQSSSSGTGSLIISGTSTGSVTCQRYMTNGKWHLISPTASGQSVAAFLTANTNIPTSGTTRGMMDYNTLGNSWNAYYPTTSASGTMDAGKGYSARIATTDGTITFTGTLASGTKDVALATTGQGWNCVGNPYTSAINMNTTAHATNNFITVNSSNLDASYACIYVWDEDAAYTGQSCYKVISNSGFSTTKTILDQNYVAPGQGFFVKAKADVANLSFTSAMQSQQVSTQLRASTVTTAKTSESAASWPGILLTATSAATSSSAIITFNEKMTDGLDVTYDAGLLRGSNGLSLYTRLVEDNGVDFAIQCLPESYDSLVIPVGIDCEDGGEITFSAETVELPLNCKVILEDRTADTFTSLTNGATYNITLTAGSTPVGRFYIHTGDDTTTGTTGLTEGINSLKAYIANQSIIIEGAVSDRATFTLYDLQGRKILVHSLQKGSLNTFSCSNLMKGFYVLTIQQDGATVTKKLVKE